MLTSALWSLKLSEDLKAELGRSTHIWLEKAVDVNGRKEAWCSVGSRDQVRQSQSPCCNVIIINFNKVMKT
jgi:hypothetical protein